MLVRQQFEQYFSESSLKSVYLDYVVFSSATGIDNFSQKKFWENIDDQVEIVSRKVLAGKYEFTKYKLKLISKGRGKVPREISIPTIRDRIALRALCNFLLERYSNTIRFDLPQKMIKSIKNNVETNTYNGFIKLDVSNFYPTINQNNLAQRLRSRIRNPEIIEFIERAIQVPTVSKSRKSDLKVKVGVPQGLSISNILAAIYLINIDKYLSKKNDIEYYRYVDDIFILCNYKDVNDISKDIIKKFKNIGLTIHDPIKNPEKSVLGKITEDFDYLGYVFKSGVVSPRNSSVERLKESIVSIFTSYKHSREKSIGFLLWRLNLRITGCVFKNKSKGWLFFFAEINNETILHNLDRHIQRLAQRFEVDISPKRFVRSFYEIKHSKYETNYVPNFDNFTLEQKIEVLRRYFSINLSPLTEEQIEYEFSKKIDRQVRDLLTDIQDFGY